MKFKTDDTERQALPVLRVIHAQCAGPNVPALAPAVDSNHNTIQCVDVNLTKISIAFQKNEN